MVESNEPSEKVKAIMANGLKRNEVFALIPEGASRILDIGYGDGCLPMRLVFEKNCKECYGIELNPVPALEPYLEKSWNLNLLEEELPEKYHGYFQWIILHDVLEHIYDPWAFLAEVNKYVADDGHVVIVCPNAQYWETPFALLTGQWPLGSNGHWNEDHIRWFTFKTLAETAIISGFGVDSAYLLYPERFKAHMREYRQFETVQGKPILELPPLGFPAGHMEDGLPIVSPTWGKNEPLQLVLNRSASEFFPYLMAIKIMLVCSKRGAPAEVNLAPGQMPRSRKAFYENLGEEELKKRQPESVTVQVMTK